VNTNILLKKNGASPQGKTSSAGSLRRRPANKTTTISSKKIPCKNTKIFLLYRNDYGLFLRGGLRSSEPLVRFSRSFHM